MNIQTYVSAVTDCLPALNNTNDSFGRRDALILATKWTHYEP